jgi:protein SCO1/2
MKKGSTVGLIVVLIIFGYIFIPKIFQRVSENDTIGSNRSVKPGYTALDFIRLNGQAKKVPDFLFLNQDSIYISNEDFLGKVYVAEFFFSRCPSICPIMNKNMKVLYDRFGDRDDFAIASFTIDPENDTPSVLKKYAEAYVDKNSSWQFLTLDKPTVYELANKGFNIFASINPAVTGGFEHQGYFALIDQNGFIRSRRDDYGNPIVYYMGIDQEEDKEQGVDQLLVDIEKLLNEK